eukprot:m.167994 g.167994  ORF g.167994 m.167994 type:complete len:471 (+) comp17784_c0_seq2:131-1543(+)
MAGKSGKRARVGAGTAAAKGTGGRTKRRKSTAKHSDDDLVESNADRKRLQAAEYEAKRLKALAQERGMFGAHRSNPARLTASRHMRVPRGVVHCSGSEITRPGARRRRQLVAFPGMISAGTDGGAIGELRHLDTEQPCLYVELPQGTVKFHGTLVYTHNSYLALECRQRSVTCAEQFDSLVVFPEFSWIGNAADNPQEEPLPVPPGVLKQLSADAQPAAACVAPRPSRASDNELDSDDGKEDNSSGQEAQPNAEQGNKQVSARPKRAAAARRKSYAEDASDESSQESQDSEEDVAPKTAVAQPKAKGQRKATVILDSSDSDSDVHPADDKQPASRPLSTKRPRRAAANVSYIGQEEQQQGSTPPSSETDSTDDTPSAPAANPVTARQKQPVQEKERATPPTKRNPIFAKAKKPTLQVAFAKRSAASPIRLGMSFGLAGNYCNPVCTLFRAIVTVLVGDEMQLSLRRVVLA